MAGSVELRDYPNAAIVRVGNEVADFSLRVVQPLGPHLLQLRKSLALHAEALIVREMPVQNIHLHGSHAVEIALQHLNRDQVAADVNEQAAPREARLVFDRDDGDRESGGGRLNQLEKSLHSVKNAERSRCRKRRAGAANRKFVRFILPELLDLVATVFGVNGQGRTCRTSFGPERDSSLP